MMAGHTQPAFRFFALEHSGGVTTVFLDKPPMNTLDKDLYPELHALCGWLDDDTTTRAIVFASRNPKVFIAGADIKEMSTYRFEEEWVRERISTVHAALNRVEDIRKPTVAAIAGHALGGGCEFALCLDFRFMARGPWRIGLPEIAIGIMPGGGGTHRLPRVVGYARAAEIILTGARMDADAAERMGLITRACDADHALPAAQEFAAVLAAQAPIASALAKDCLKKSWELDRESALALERENCLRAVLSQDAREGISAFIEKRKPTWKGE